MPSWWLFQYSLWKGGSVPSCWVTWYCSGDSRFLSSASLGLTKVFFMASPDCVEVVGSSARGGAARPTSRAPITEASRSSPKRNRIVVIASGRRTDPPVDWMSGSTKDTAGDGGCKPPPPSRRGGGDAAGAVGVVGRHDLGLLGSGDDGAAARVLVAVTHAGAADDPAEPREGAGAEEVAQVQGRRELPARGDRDRGTRVVEGRTRGVRREHRHRVALREAGRAAAD